MAEMNASELYPSNVIAYNFTAIRPINGTCEFQQLGSYGPFAQPYTTAFGVLTAFEGLFGLISSCDVGIGSRYMFSLLLGYGLSSAAHNATLWNGFLKTSGSMLLLMQAIIVIRLINTLKFPPFNSRKYFSHGVNNILSSTFGIYPIIAGVLSSSSEDSWIEWLTFDIVWAIILVIGIVIFIYRKEYPQYDICPEIFHLVFYAMATCILAYFFWIVDRFACSWIISILQFYGLWLLLIGLTFYYLTVLDIFLQSRWEGYNPVITRWPRKYIMLMVYINWEPHDESNKNANKMANEKANTGDSLPITTSTIYVHTS